MPEPQQDDGTLYNRGPVQIYRLPSGRIRMSVRVAGEEVSMSVAAWHRLAQRIEQAVQWYDGEYFDTSGPWTEGDGEE